MAHSQLLLSALPPNQALAERIRPLLKRDPRALWRAAYRAVQRERHRVAAAAAAAAAPERSGRSAAQLSSVFSLVRSLMVRKELSAEDPGLQRRFEGEAADDKAQLTLRRTRLPYPAYLVLQVWFFFCIFFCIYWASNPDGVRSQPAACLLPAQAGPHAHMQALPSPLAHLATHARHARLRRFLNTRLGRWPGSSVYLYFLLPMHTHPHCRPASCLQYLLLVVAITPTFLGWMAVLILLALAYRAVGSAWLVLLWVPLFCVLYLVLAVLAIAVTWLLLPKGLKPGVLHAARANGVLEGQGLRARREE